MTAIVWKMEKLQYFVMTCVDRQRSRLMQPGRDRCVYQSVAECSFHLLRAALPAPFPDHFRHHRRHVETGGLSVPCMLLMTTGESSVIAQLVFISFCLISDDWKSLTTGNLVWYCQSTKAKVTLWSVDLIEGLNCWNML